MRLFTEAPAQRGLFSCSFLLRRKHEVTSPMKAPEPPPSTSPGSTPSITPASCSS